MHWQDDGASHLRWVAGARRLEGPHVCGGTAHLRRVRTSARAGSWPQAVLALGPPAARARVGRVVTLGTPTWGAPAIATVLQGTHPVLARLAALHPGHDARALARSVFATFPSTHVLLPWRERWTGPDLDREEAWSTQWPGPRPELLASSRRSWRPPGHRSPTASRRS